MKVAIEVSKKAAILDGREDWGTQVVDLDLQTLDTEEREYLARLAEKQEAPSPSCPLVVAVEHPRGGEIWHRITTARIYADAATPDEARRVLRLAIEGEKAATAKAEEYWADVYNKTKASIDKWLNTPDDEIVRLKSEYATPQLVIVSYPKLPDTDFCNCNRGAVWEWWENHRPDMKDRFATLQALVKERNEEARAEHEQKEKAEQKQRDYEREKDAEKERADEEQHKAITSAWVDKYATPNQRERFEANVLPEEEILSGLRDLVFEPLKKYERYVRLRVSDLPCTCDEYGCGASFEAYGAETMSAGQWTAAKEMREAMEKTKGPSGESVNVEIELRIHEGECASCEKSAKRSSFLATVTLGPLTLSREYAADFDDPESLEEVDEGDATLILQNGERIPLRLTTEHSASRYGMGVLLNPQGEVVDGAGFNALVEEQDARIETDNPPQIAAALGVPWDLSMKQKNIYGRYRPGMPRSEYYAYWDGKCKRCGHSYFECRGNCTCLACNAQRQDEVASGLIFEGDSQDE